MVGSSCLLNESKNIQTRVPRKSVDFFDPSFVTARPQGGFPLSRKFYVRVHTRKFYSRKENRDEVWTESVGLKTWSRARFNFYFYARAIFQTLPLFYLRTEILSSYEVKITRPWKSTLRALSQSQNWPAGPWPDQSFWQKNKLFTRVFAENHLLTIRIWLIWLDSLD